MNFNIRIRFGIRFGRLHELLIRRRRFVSLKKNKKKKKDLKIFQNKTASSTEPSSERTSFLVYPVRFCSNRLSAVEDTAVPSPKPMRIQIRNWNFVKYLDRKKSID